MKEAPQPEAKTISEEPQTDSEKEIELGRYIEELKAALEVSYGDEIIQFANSDAQYIPFTSLQMENDPDLISQINELKDSFAHSDSSATEDFKPQIQTKSLEAESIREILDKLPASFSDDGKTNIEYLNEVLYNKREEEPTWAVSAQKSAVLDLMKTSNQVVGTGIRATFYARAVYTSVPFGPLGGSIRFLIQAAIFEGGCWLGSYPVGWVRTGVEKVAASTGTSEQDAAARADLAGTAFDTTLNIAVAKILFGKPRFVANLKGADRVNRCLLKLDEFLKKGGSIEALEAAGVKAGRIMELINEGSSRLIEGEIFGMQPELAVEAAGGGFGFKRGFLLPKAKGKVAGGARATEGIAGEVRAGGMEGIAGESGPSISYSKRHDSGSTNSVHKKGAFFQKTYYQTPKTLPAFPKAVTAPKKGERSRWEDKRRIYEFDYENNKVEVYSRKTGKHLGEFDYLTGKQAKPADKSRKVER